MKIDNNTLLSSIASGLLINAVYPSTAEMIKILGNVVKKYKVVNCLAIDLIVCILKVLIIVPIFFLLWQFITLFFPAIINCYEKSKKVKYIAMTEAKKKSLFYEVFNEIMCSELNKDGNYKASEFYCALNKMMRLSDRLILSVTKNKSDLSLMNSILRTKSKNQHCLNSKNYINAYDLRGALDVLIENMKILETVYGKLKIADSFLLSDLQNSKGQLEQIKEEIKNMDDSVCIHPELA